MEHWNIAGRRDLRRSMPASDAPWVATLVIDMSHPGMIRVSQTARAALCYLAVLPAAIVPPLCAGLSDVR